MLPKQKGRLGLFHIATAEHIHVVNQQSQTCAHHDLRLDRCGGSSITTWLSGSGLLHRSGTGGVLGRSQCVW